jgi:hypothetical protein
MASGGGATELYVSPPRNLSDLATAYQEAFSTMLSPPVSG